MEFLTFFRTMKNSYWHLNMFSNKSLNQVNQLLKPLKLLTLFERNSILTVHLSKYKVPKQKLGYLVCKKEYTYSNNLTNIS